MLPFSYLQIKQIYILHSYNVNEPLLGFIYLFIFLAFHFIKNKVFSSDYCIQGSLKHNAIRQCRFSLSLFAYTLWVSNLPVSSPFHNKIMYLSILVPCYLLSPKYFSQSFKILKAFLVSNPVSSKLEFLFFSMLLLPLHCCSCRHLSNV